MGRNLRPYIRIPANEVSDYLDAQRVVVVCSLNKDGSVHAMPMWYVLDADGRPVITTPVKSQKALNLRRDRRVTWLVESGEHYEELQGIQGKGEAEIFESTDALVTVAVAIDEKYRHTSPSSARLEELEHQMSKRIGLTLPIDSIASWDHRRLQDPSIAKQR